VNSSVVISKQERGAMNEQKWRELTTSEVPEISTPMESTELIARMPSATDKVKWQTLVIVATGSNGGGKSLFLTVHQTEQLIKAHYAGFHVWSNYKVGFWYNCPLHRRKCFLHSEPLDMNAFYTFDKGLVWGWVYIDEIDKWMDCQEWQNVTQKIVSKVLTLIRHRQLSLGLTIQDLDWLNSRLKFQVDAELSCRDASFTPWGKSIGLKKGEVTNITARDYTGKLTGYMYKETGRVYTVDMRARWAWHHYDTFAEFDPMEGNARYTIERKEMRIDADGHVIDMTAYKKEKQLQLDTARGIILPIIVDLRNEGCDSIGKAEFRAKLYEKGINLPIQDLGRILSSLNVEKKDRTYDLSFVNE
jgi:hypothetical protein